MNQKEFIKKLKDFRIKNNLTQEEAADALSVTVRSYRAWVYAKNFPKMKTYWKLMELLGNDN